MGPVRAEPVRAEWGWGAVGHALAISRTRPWPSQAAWSGVGPSRPRRAEWGWGGVGLATRTGQVGPRRGGWGRVWPSRAE